MSESKRSIPFFRFAWRNTRRNTRRTMLTVSAIAVAVMALTYTMSHIEGIMTNMLDTLARTESGHVRIRKAGYSDRERAMPMHLFVPNLSVLISQIENHPGVETALPRIRASVLVDVARSNRPGLFMGVDLAREEGYLNPSSMTVEGKLPRPGFGEVLMGRGFAEKLEVEVGDTLTLLGQTAYRSLGGLSVIVTGLGESGISYLDNRLLLASIDQVQLMTDLDNAATEILVFAEDPETADSLAAELSAVLDAQVPGGLEVLSWRDQGPIVRMMDSMVPMLAVFFFILLFMASLIIINTMLMTVMERTREFGMLAALGMRRSDIVRLIVLEGLVIGLIGAAIGGVLGTGIAVWIEQVGIDVTAAAKGIEMPFQGRIYPDWTPLYTVFSGFLGMITAVMASLYPAFRAVQKTPAEAIRG